MPDDKAYRPLKSKGALDLEVIDVDGKQVNMTKLMLNHVTNKAYYASDSNIKARFMGGRAAHINVKTSVEDNLEIGSEQVSGRQIIMGNGVRFAKFLDTACSRQ